MAVTVQLYNHTTKLFANGQVDVDNCKVMLLNSSGSFDATHTNISSISGNQVSGNGWASGGVLIGNGAVTTVSTNDAKFDGDDISVTATGGSIGPADYACIYDATGSYPLAFITFDPLAQMATVGNDFDITWHANGIITWTYS